MPQHIILREELIKLSKRMLESAAFARAHGEERHAICEEYWRAEILKILDQDRRQST